MDQRRNDGFLDGSNLEDTLVEAPVAEDMDDNLMTNKRRGTGQSWDSVERDSMSSKQYTLQIPIVSHSGEKMNRSFKQIVLQARTKCDHSCWTLTIQKTRCVALSHFGRPGAYLSVAGICSLALCGNAADL